MSSILAVRTNRSAKQFKRSRTSRRDLHGLYAGTGQDGVERIGELPGAVADQEPEGCGAVVEVHQQVADLLGGPGSGRMARRAEDVHVAASHFDGEDHIDPFQHLVPP